MTNDPGERQNIAETGEQYEQRVARENAQQPDLEEPPEKPDPSGSEAAEEPGTGEAGEAADEGRPMTDEERKAVAAQEAKASPDAPDPQP